MSKKSLKEFIKKNPPTNIKVGDYVEVQGTKIGHLFNAQDIYDLIKRTKNILYVWKVGNGMVTLTRSRVFSSPKVQVPIKYIRYKLTNVEE